MPRFQVLISLLLFLQVAPAFAGSEPHLFTTPGRYRVVGVLEWAGKRLVLHVFKGTQSQVELDVKLPADSALSDKALFKLGSLPGRSVEMLGTVAQAPR